MMYMPFMPSCREVATKLSSGEFDGFPLHKRLLIRLHLFMCDLCSRYARQLKLLGEAFRLRRKGADPSTVLTLKEQLKKRFHHD